MKLTMAAAKAHQRACDLLATQRPLTMEEREFVLRHWQESQNSTTVTTLAGAFFTPLDLAKDVALHVSGAMRLIDLGAGIGALAWSAYRKMVAGYLSPPPVEIVCVERNPEYVAVGRRVLPEAEWICADLFALPAGLRGVEREFDVAISNPPFGRTPRSGRGPRYTGHRAEYHVIDVAADLARRGVFLVPQTSAPFRYSGTPDRRWDRSAEYLRFVGQTGIELHSDCGIDAATYLGWRDVRPAVEIVTCDFTERRTPRQLRLPPPGGQGQLALLAA
jgi:predicted RNA methylase